TYYGEQEKLSVSDLNSKAIARSRFLYLDGYALHSDHNRETFMTAIEWAHEAGGLVAFNPNDVSILNQYTDLCGLLMDVVDILICNDVEAMLITGASDAHRAADALRPRFARGAVTIGAQGALLFNEQGTI